MLRVAGNPDSILEGSRSLPSFIVTRMFILCLSICSKHEELVENLITEHCHALDLTSSNLGMVFSY